MKRYPFNQQIFTEHLFCGKNPIRNGTQMYRNQIRFEVCILRKTDRE